MKQEIQSSPERTMSRFQMLVAILFLVAVSISPLGAQEARHRLLENRPLPFFGGPNRDGMTAEGLIQAEMAGRTTILIEQKYAGLTDFNDPLLKEAKESLSRGDITKTDYKTILDMFNDKKEEARNRERTIRNIGDLFKFVTGQMDQEYVDSRVKDAPLGATSTFVLWRELRRIQNERAAQKLHGTTSGKPETKNRNSRRIPRVKPVTQLRPTASNDGDAREQTPEQVDWLITTEVIREFVT